MQRAGLYWRLASLVFALPFVLLGGCAHSRHTDDEINVYPANYKADILAAMHAYLNDPTGIRDPAIAEPALKSIGGITRYVVCLRFNAKQSATVYAGTRETAAVFVVGRFDRFAEGVHEQCTGSTYVPFPELGKLTR